MINSQVFKRQGGTMNQIGYLNQKFFSGISLKTGESMATPTMIGPEVGKMLDLCHFAGPAVPRIFSRFKDNVKVRDMTPNWYLPVHLGGFGVGIKHAPDSWYVSPMQRRLARCAVNSPSFQLFRLMGQRLNLARFSGALAKWSLVPGSEPDFDDSASVGDGVLSARLHDDDWLGRLAYAGRAMLGNQQVSLRTAAWSLPGLGWKEIRRQGPMKDVDLMAWVHASFVAHGTPDCPSQSALRFFFPSLEDLL